MKNSENKNTFENASAGDRKLIAMLGDLNRVAAPNDFEFRLKARIADRSAVKQRSFRLFPTLVYGAPLALFLVVGSTLFLLSSYDAPNLNNVAVVQDLPAASGDKPASPIAEVRSPHSSQTNSALAKEEIAEGGRTLLAAEKTADRSVTTGLVSKNERTVTGRKSGGSYTIGAKRAETPKRITGFSGNVDAKLSEAGGDRDISVKEIFQSIGIDAEFSDNAWLVKSVKGEQIGDRVGIKSGDRIDSIDSKPVDKDTKYRGRFAAKSIRIQRDGKLIDLELK